MSQNRTLTFATYALLAAAAATTFVLPRTLTVPTLVAAPGDEVILNGVIRDFPGAHVDFDVIPSNGYGHYAGIVNNWLPGTRRPVFVGDGFKVNTQWKNIDNRAIAPSAEGVRGGLARKTLGFRVDGAIDLRQDTVLDGFNSNYGPYGVMGNFGMDAVIFTNTVASGAVKVGKNAYVRGDVLVGVTGTPSDVIRNDGIITGTQGTVAEPIGMPVVNIPDDALDLAPYKASLTLSGTVMLSGDTTPDDDVNEPAMHVGDLRIQADAVVTVVGDLRIRVDRSLEIDKAQIVLAPDANLAIWVSDIGGGTGAVIIRNDALVNVGTGDTSDVTISAIGAGDLKIESRSHVYATIVAPQREVRVRNNAQLYGAIVAGALKVEDKGSGVHVDLGNADLPPGNFALSVREKIELDNATLDAFDSNDGPYGGVNVDTNAWCTTNAIDTDQKVHLKSGSVINGDVMIGPFGDPDRVYRLEGGSVITGSRGQIAAPYPIPIVTPPAMGVARVNEVKYDDAGTHELSSDLYVKKLKVENATTLRIKGDVTIRVDDEMEIKGGSSVVLKPGATLTLYINKELDVDQSSALNANTGDPQRVSIRMMSLGKKGKVKVRNGSTVVAWTQGAKSSLEVDNGEYFGSFTGQKAKFRGGAKMHVDMAYLTNCVTVLDTAGVAGALDNAGISSESSFDEWFRTLVGVNQTIGHPITLTKDVLGVYSYLDDAFYPIDDRLMGNEGDAHNNHFTYTIAGTFDYSECAGQFVEFEGGDGAWIYIDGRLALDLGGMRPLSEQFIDLDRLGLEDGQTYDLRLFYAQRQAGRSVFRLRTNLLLDSNRAVPAITAMFD